MRGDFSRLRFNRGKNYTAVLEQQGRVDLDSDANEQRFIDEFLRRSETVDIIGEFGAPADDAGFKITVVNDGILIGGGRYYVDGLMCENLESLSYDSQPYLIDPGDTSAGLLTQLATAGQPSVLQVYLEVWERLVTALDDPCLREPALGRADTTARVQTVWRVLGLVLPAEELRPVPGSKLSPCCDAMYLRRSFGLSPGMMCAQPSPPSDDCGCEPVPAAGYQGVENQLYRVEIHQQGTLTDATFKWSRENGSVVSAVTGISGSTLQLSTLGPDANLGFQVGQWVELTDDTYLFGETPNQPGTLYQIQSVQPADLSVTLAGPVTPVDPTRNARLRRWDQTGPSATSAGIPVSAGSTTLENGIQVSFTAGAFRSGDYWTIPARTATGQIDWPPCDSDGNQCQPPQSVVVQVAPLACIHWVGESTHVNAGFVVDDCRRIFNPLTELSPAAAVQAIHVDDISWPNDDIMTLDQLVTNGLTITLDQAPVSPVNGANFIVTMESFMLGATMDPVGPGQTLLTVLRQIIALDSELSVAGTVLSWLLPPPPANPPVNLPDYQSQLLDYLNKTLLIGAPASQWARVRIRLLGAAIFATAANGAQLYLDGQAFGQPALRQDGSTARIDLQLPSGTDVAASDFDGWFYLAPALQLVTLTVEYEELTAIVDQYGQFIGVQPTGSSEAVTPTATITVNYPAALAATVTLALTGPAGVESIASIPASQTIDVGQTSATFLIDVTASPPYTQTFDFTITATLAPANLPGNTQQKGFSITGPVSTTTN